MLPANCHLHCPASEQDGLFGDNPQIQKEALIQGLL